MTGWLETMDVQWNLSFLWDASIHGTLASVPMVCPE